MTIDPHQLPIHALFEMNHTFEVPRYQRSYAWDEDAIDDFIDDIAQCLNVRQAGTKRSHFFGGVVTVRVPVQNSSRNNQEVIDGQQRLSSFIMLAAAIVSVMEALISELDSIGAKKKANKEAKGFFEKTVDTMKKHYLFYEDSVKLTYIDIPKMTLSTADEEYFRNLIAGTPIAAERTSHHRMQLAWDKLRAFVEGRLSKVGSVAEKAEILKHLILGVLFEDCTVIFMSSDTRSEAYQIFQVLNDRGVTLTDGDLLRARTLESLEDRKDAQDHVSRHWDRILNLQPAKIDAYLRWYFASTQGVRPKNSAVADQFLTTRFKVDKDDAAKKMTKSEAKHIVDEVKLLDVEFVKLAILEEGDWPYNHDGKTATWDRERLRMLVKHLKHTNAMPLLQSLCFLPADKFAAAVSSIERFVFRYKTIGGGHVSGMNEVYLKYAKSIREAPETFSLSQFRNDLSVKMLKSVPDDVFAANLRATQYSSSQANGYVRYMFITIEDHLAWIGKGAQGVPKCTDKTRVFDFVNTTLEHVYPRRTEAGEQEAGLEKVKNALGNLTILSLQDNNKNADKAFGEKKGMLAASSLKLNRSIAANAAWTADTVNQRTEEIVQMALKVFIP